jgi:hypothetical protein
MAVLAARTLAGSTYKAVSARAAPRLRAPAIIPRIPPRNDGWFPYDETSAHIYQQGSSPVKKKNRDRTARKLAGMFFGNFVQYADQVTSGVRAAGFRNAG